MITRGELAREAAEAEAVAAAEERGEVAPTPGQRARRPADASQVYSLRLPAEAIEQLRGLAEARGEAPTAMLRRFVLDRLAQEQAGRAAPAAGAADVVADVVAALGQVVSGASALETSLAGLPEVQLARARRRALARGGLPEPAVASRALRQGGGRDLVLRGPSRPVRPRSGS